MVAATNCPSGVRTKDTVSPFPVCRVSPSIVLLNDAVNDPLFAVSIVVWVSPRWLAVVWAPVRSSRRGSYVLHSLCLHDSLLVRILGCRLPRLLLRAQGFRGSCPPANPSISFSPNVYHSPVGASRSGVALTAAGGAHTRPAPSDAPVPAPPEDGADLHGWPT